MSVPDDKIIGTMELYGGGFVKSLAKAWRFADLNNQARLKAAFPEYWKTYAEMHQLSEERDKLRELGSLSFESDLVLESSYNSKLLGPHVNDMALYSRYGELSIEWTYWPVGRDHDSDTTHIGLELDGENMVTGYDGVFELPRQAIQLLEQCGYKVDPSLKEDVQDGCLWKSNKADVYAIVVSLHETAKSPSVDVSSMYPNGALGFMEAAVDFAIRFVDLADDALVDYGSVDVVWAYALEDRIGRLTQQAGLFSRLNDVSDDEIEELILEFYKTVKVSENADFN